MLSFLLLLLTTTTASKVLFGGETSIILADEDRYNNTAFNFTFQDFLNDFYNAFGLIALANNPGYIPYICSIDGVGQYSNISTITTLYLGLFSSNPYPQTLLSENDRNCYKGKESHCVEIVFDASKNIYSMIAMSNDTMGAIYAIYTISELILGVDPLYRFSGIQGEYFPDGIMLSSSLSYFYPAPLFEYRAIFNNDEDLLGGWAADPLGLSVHSATVYNWYFESCLRLKCNSMIVGTVPYPDENSLKLAAKRGITITDHHFNLLGMNTFRFPGAELANEWDYTQYPLTPTFVWKHSAIALADLGTEIIYSVGYRGTNDQVAPCSNCTTEQLGMVISQVIGNMTAFLPEKSMKITYMWGEAINLFKAGYLVLPPDVDMLLSDNGVGYIEDLQFANESSGVYTHVAYYGRSNQLTEMVPPQRQFQQLGTFSNTSKKNKYVIINTSDLRPYLLSTSAVFCYVYDPAKCGNGTEFIVRWCKTRYRLRTGDSDWVSQQIANLYERYYNISYVNQGLSDVYLHETMYTNAGAFYDNLQANGTVTTTTLQKIHSTLFSNETINYVIDLYQDSMDLYEKIKGNLTQSSRELFEAHILLQQSIHYYCNLIMLNTYYGASAYYQRDYQTAFDFVQKAYDFYGAMFRNFRIWGERGVFRGLYQNSHIADLQSNRAQFRKLYVMASNRTNWKHCTLPLRPYTYYAFMWYQCPFEDNYPYINFNRSAHLSSYIRVYCVNSGSEINNMNETNCCINNAEGGIFHVYQGRCEMGAAVKMNVTDWNLCPIIKYTKDGTEPNANSLSLMQANNVINITTTTPINARCQYQNKSLDEQITKTNFVKL